MLKNKKIGEIDFKTRQHISGAVILWNSLPIIQYRENKKYKVWFILGVPVWRQNKKIKKRLISSFFYSPKQIPSAIGLQRIVQLSSFELLKYIREVCRENEIEFWLDYGTLLGAVRHDGFIPWDDDVDIAMTRKNWEKMRALVPHVFSEQIFSYNINSLGFIQIGVKGTTMNVDIFPYDQADSGWSPSSNKESEFVNRIYNAGSAINYKMNSFSSASFQILDINYETRQEIFKSKILLGKSSSVIGNWFLAYDVGFVGKMHKHTYMNNWIFPLSQKEFEGEKFNIPNKFELILHSKYGDWGEIPSDGKIHINLELIDSDMLELMKIIIDKGLESYIASKQI